MEFEVTIQLDAYHILANPINIEDYVRETLDYSDYYWENLYGMEQIDKDTYDKLAKTEIDVIMRYITIDEDSINFVGLEDTEDKLHYTIAVEFDLDSFLENN